MVTPARHLIVDGHNVLHAWGWMSEGEPMARERLISTLRVLHDVESLGATVVFDSRSGAGHVDPASTAEGLVVRFAAAGLSADGEIERLVVGDANPQRFVVCTSDALIRGNVLAAGAEVILPEELRGRVERAQARARRRIHVRGTAPGGFGNKLPL